MEDKYIYHITTLADWNNAQLSGNYIAPSLKSEGFIHCSKAEQVEGVLQRYYSGISGLLKLVIDPALLVHPPVYEMAPSVNQLFPHIYGAVNIDAVIYVQEI